MSTLSGNVVIRNGNELDFCWRECIKSLLPVCDIVTVCDGESTDGTQQEIRKWIETEPKIKLCVWKWPDPKGQIDFFANWINYCREHCRSDWQIQLDADEILSEKSYDEVRQFIQSGPRTAVVTRYNFYKDHRHIFKDGICCGKYVVRIAPQNIFLASDGFDARGVTAASMGVQTGIEIFHYGFLRKREEFFKKERLLQQYFFNTFDARLEKAEKKKGNWMTDPALSCLTENLDKYNGPHPLIAHEWLKERGYKV